MIIEQIKTYLSSIDSELNLKFNRTSMV